MLRSKEPLYRPVLRDAFLAAWHARRAWPVALIAGILFSGSVYDALWKLMNSLAPQMTVLSIIALFTQKVIDRWSGFSFADLLLGGLQVLQVTILLLIVGFTIVGVSVICQGALVAFLGARGSGNAMRMREALTVGARAFWPVFVLNGLAFLVLWGTKVALGVTLALSAEAATGAGFLLYLLAFIVLGAVALAAAIIQVFALHAMILQGATLVQALERAGRLLQEHWVVALETAGLLFVISFGITLLLTVGVVLLFVPLFLILLAGGVMGVTALLDIALYVCMALVVTLLLIVGGYLITLQYATWTGLYHRLGEGGALPKIHRWFRQLTHGFHVPGS